MIKGNESKENTLKLWINEDADQNAMYKTLISKIIITSEVKRKLNVIFMIGDGMGQNHIKVREIMKSEKLHMQTIQNQTDVRTDFLLRTTDSAATALSAGVKTKNYYVGKNANGNDLETLMEYSKKIELKAGTVSTQTIYHATPAEFIAHTSNREDYTLITRRLFGKEEYFEKKELNIKVLQMFLLI